MSVKKYELIYFNLNGIVDDNDQGCKKVGHQKTVTKI